MHFSVKELENYARQADNVVFDVGNVLFRFDTDHIRSAFLSPENRQKLGDAMFIPDHEWHWGQFDKGLWPDEEVARRIAAHAGLPHAWREVLGAYEHFHEDRVPLPLVQDLKCLKAMGKRIFALTNYGVSGFARAERQFSFFELFDGIVVSGREQMWKPNAEIFLLAQTRYALVPGRTLLIDDSAANVAAAAALGWQTWHYTGYLNG